MFRPKIKARIYTITGLFAGLLAVFGCQKIVHGYLSDNIYYQLNPFNVQQGLTTTSSVLVSNSSTSPLHVELLSIVNLSTGQSADSAFLKPDTIKVYKSAVTYQDSTLDLLNAKLEDSLVAPFSIGSIGGRLQFTQATEYVDTGSYSISIKVSNVRGEKTLSNACTINLSALTTIDSIDYLACTTSPDAALSSTSNASSSFSCTIDYENTDDNKIIFKFYDKDNNLFDPAKGEVTGRSGRPSFSDWDPYYKPVLTDTSIEFEYPSGVPQMPMFDVSSYGTGFGRGIIYYQIPGSYTDIGQYINPVATIWYYKTEGTYIVNYRFSNVSRVTK